MWYGWIGFLEELQLKIDVIRALECLLIANCQEFFSLTLLQKIATLPTISLPRSNGGCFCFSATCSVPTMRILQFSKRFSFFKMYFSSLLWERENLSGISHCGQSFILKLCWKPHKHVLNNSTMMESKRNGTGSCVRKKTLQPRLWSHSNSAIKGNEEWGSRAIETLSYIFSPT